METEKNDGKGGNFRWHLAGSGSRVFFEKVKSELRHGESEKLTGAMAGPAGRAFPFLPSPFRSAPLLSLCEACL